MQTTWSTLIDDAVAGRFDLALSSIAVTEERSRIVDLSHPYARSRNVAVVRCADQARYRSFDDLNSPNVTIFVRHASSTMSYVTARFSNARIHPTRNLMGAYPRLVAGEADVIIDSDYLHRHHPGLCLAFEAAPFNPVPIAALLPKNSTLLGDVNTWLEERVDDGTVAQLLRHYGAP